MPRAVILTALPVEYLAVRSHLSDLQEEMHPQGTIYERGKFIANDREWEVGVVETGAGNAGSAVEAERAISYFKPDILFFVGIAGGIKDVAIGDVVAATKVYSYESGKAGEQFLTRPTLGQSSYALVQRARSEGRKGDWVQRLSSRTAPVPTVFVAPIAAGEKVVASRQSEVFQFLRESYNDAVAVEMEGFGFLSAAFAYPEIKAIVIRGISDLIEGKNDDSPESGQEPEQIRQEKASHHASAFAFKILSKLPLDQFKEKQENDSNVVDIHNPNPGYQIVKLYKEKTYDEFIRRTDEVNSILAQLEDEDANRVISLVGLGGIGKTALCHYVATKAWKKKISKRIIWIRAKKKQFDPLTSDEESTQRTSTLTFEQALKEIGDQIPETTNYIREDIEKLKGFVAKKLTDMPSLVVIDGLEDSKNPKILATELKLLLGKSHLILTTRNQVDAYTYQLDVNKMNLDDSREYLMMIARNLNCKTILRAKESEISEILKITDGMPLAMKLVVSHNAKYWSIDRILERLSSVTDEQKLYDYIFEDAWQELKRQDAIVARILLIYLSDDSEPIPLRLLYGIENDEGNPLSQPQVDEGIKLLKQLSLVEITENIVSLHSLTAHFFGETIRSRYE